MIIVYGLKNCDTCRKTKKWLDEERINYSFRDFRNETPNEERIKSWVLSLGMNEILNKRGMTWRNLKIHEKKDVSENDSLVLLTKYPTLIKRPIFEINGNIKVGFTYEVKKALKDNKIDHKN